MADAYIWSGASGANDGSSWANAWTSEASSTGVAAGTRLLKASDHNQTISGNTTWNWSNNTESNPITMVSVNRSTGLEEYGARVYNSSGTLVLQRAPRLHSCLYEGNNTQIHFSNSLYGEASNCCFKNALVIHSHSTRLIKTIIDQSGLATWQNLRMIAGGNGIRVIYDGLTIIPAATTNVELFNFLGINNSLEINDSDLSQSWSGGLVNLSSGTLGINVSINRCKVADLTKVVVGDAANGMATRVEAIDCAVGTISGSTPGLSKWWRYPGAVTTSTSVYRSSGASNGIYPYSWAMASNANAVPSINPLYTPWIPVWLRAGVATTIRLYVAGGSTLTNADFWMELSAPSTEVLPTAQGYTQSGRPGLLDTPVNLPTDSTSTWIGSGVGTKQYVESTAFVPSLDGFAYVRGAFAKASATAYMDAAAYVNGRRQSYQRFAGGLQVSDSAGGGRRPRMMTLGV